MAMRTEILTLQQMGQMPNERTGDYLNDEIVNRAKTYRTLLETIQKPQNIAEAEVLISLFPQRLFF